MSRAAALPDPLRGRAFAVSQAASMGVKPSRLRAKDLDRPFQGVRIPATFAREPAVLCRAYAQRAGDSIIFSHVTAARLWGIPVPLRLQRDDRLHVLVVDTGRSRRGRGVIGHKTGAPPDVVELGGLRVTAPIDTLLSLGDMLSLDELILAGDRMVGLPDPLADYQQLVARVNALVGTRGARRLRAAMTEIRPGSRSPRETQVRVAVTRAGLPEPELNAAILLRDGSVVHGDLVYRELRILLEYEGDQHRTDDRQWANDLRRYNALSEAGWIVIRISRHMSSDEIVAALRRALAVRGIQV